MYLGIGLNVKTITLDSSV